MLSSNQSKKKKKIHGQVVCYGALETLSFINRTYVLWIPAKGDCVCRVSQKDKAHHLLRHWLWKGSSDSLRG